MDLPPAPPASPQITMTSSSLTFAPLAVGGSSSQTITVANLSSSAVTVTPSISGDFMISANGCAVLVAPNGQCNVFVRFVPTTNGARSGQLTINYAGATAPFTVPLSGTGAGAVQLSTNSLTFAPLAINTGSSSQTVNILNQTGATVTLSFSMSDPDFIVSANNCPASLPANSGCTIYVRFTPKAASALAGTLTINANGSSVGTVSLSGTGVGGPITFDKTSLTFAPLAKNLGSSSQMVNILNKSGVAITVTPSMSDPDFIVSSNNCPASMPNGNGCTLWIRFTPKSVGPLGGTLTITAGSTIGTVSLSGSGL